MKTLVFFAAVVFVFGGTKSQYDESCRSHAGESGTCKKLQDCPSALEQVLKTRSHDKTRCGFVDSEEVVCCTDLPGTDSVDPASSSEPVWGDTDETKPTIPSKNGVPTRPPLRTTERKSERACEKYSNEISITVNYHILGGQPADPGEFPHMAALGYQRNDVWTWECGGSLISERYVLTAAHCIINADRLRPARVRLGSVNLEGDGKSPAPQDFGVENITVFSGYIRRTSANDIALIRLDKTVIYSEYILPACLYTKMDDPKGLVVTGWGHIDPTMTERSEVLQKAILSPIPFDSCNATYSRRMRVLSNNQLCAGSASGLQDSCTGDSGGPLQVFTNKIYSIVGIISFGVGCGGNIPGVYTRVAGFLDWIETIVWPDM